MILDGWIGTDRKFFHFLIPFSHVSSWLSAFAIVRTGGVPPVHA
jgi:hypothetical protein